MTGRQWLWFAATFVGVVAFSAFALSITVRAIFVAAYSSYPESALVIYSPLLVVPAAFVAGIILKVRRRDSAAGLGLLWGTATVTALIGAAVLLLRVL